jgi:hypothetical protein
MKTYLNRIIMLMAFSATIFLVACEDEEEQPNVVIQQLDATSAYPLDQVTIQGTNLHTVQFVFVGIRQAQFEVESENSLIVTIPDNAVSGENMITLALPQGHRVNTEFEVLVRPIPIIHSISPSAAAPGETVTITGSSLDNLQSITVGGVSASVDASSTAEELIFTVPDGLPENTPATITISKTSGETSSESIFYVGENLIANSDLEQGSGNDFDNFVKLNGADGMTAVTGDAAFAGRSMRIVGAAGNPWDTQLATDPIPLIDGVEYTIMLWARAEEEGAIMRVSVSQFPQDYFYGDDISLTTEWEQYSWTFTGQELPEGSRIVLDMGTTNVPFVIDNITLVATGMAGASNILTNSNFEDGLTGWEVLNGGDAIAITSDEAHSGSSSVRVEPAGGNPWDRQMASDGVPLTFEGTYEIKLWAKAEGPGGVMRVSVSQWDGQGADYFYGDDIEIAEEWTEYSWTFQVTNDLETHRVVLDMGVGTQVFYIDDVTLTEVQ